MKRSKYGANPTTVDGIRFASMKEAARYGELRRLQSCGLLRGLELQPRFDCNIDGIHVCTYVADFRYTDRRGDIIEDVKGVETAVFKLKRKLVEALHGITITTYPPKRKASTYRGRK